MLPCKNCSCCQSSAELSQRWQGHAAACLRTAGYVALYGSCPWEYGYKAYPCRQALQQIMHGCASCHPLRAKPEVSGAACALWVLALQQRGIDAAVLNAPCRRAVALRVPGVEGNCPRPSTSAPTSGTEPWKQVHTPAQGACFWQLGVKWHRAADLSALPDFFCDLVIQAVLGSSFALCLCGTDV